MVFQVEVRVPRSTKYRPDDATSLLKGLRAFVNSEGYDFQLLTIRTEGRSIVWRYEAPRENANVDHLQSVFNSFYPKAKLAVYEPVSEPIEPPYYQRVLVFQRNVDLPAWTPLRTAHDIRQSDPLGQIVQAMSEVRAGEVMRYDLVNWGSIRMGMADIDHALSQPIYEADPDYFIRGTNGNLFAILTRQFLHKISPDKRRVPIFSEHEEQVIRAKLEQSPAAFVAYLSLMTPDPDRLNWLSSVAVAFKSFAQNDYPMIADPVVFDHAIKTNEDKIHPNYLIGEVYTNSDDAQKRDDVSLYLAPEELAALWHLPHDAFNAPKVSWVDEEQAPLPQALHDLPDDAVKLGDGYADGKKRPARMLEEDRAMHMLITGQTGAGKSTLALNLIHQDIEQGRGVAVIDPKANLVQDILQRSIAAGREKDVVIWDLANVEYPPPLNFLLDGKGAANPEAVALLMAVFTKYFGSEFARKEMAETLQRSLETIMAEEQPTLRDVRKLLIDEQFRDSLVAKTSNIAVEEFWEEFEAMVRGQGPFFRPVLRRLRNLYGNELLYPILCNPAMLNVRELMEQKKIILFNLRPPKGQAPPTDDIGILGSIIMSAFQLAVSTDKLPEPYYLYVDEAHRFVTSALDDIFVMARSQNLRMVLITQYPKQLPTDTLQAVLENVGATFTFKCADETARIMKGRMAPQFEAADLVGMDLHKAAARILYEGHQLPAFLLETMPPPEPTANAEEREVWLRAQSDKRLNLKTSDEVRDWLDEKYPRRQSDPTSNVSDDEAYSSWAGEDDNPETNGGEDYEKPSAADENGDDGEDDII